MPQLTYRNIDDPRLRGWIYRERVRCGNPGCHCSTGRKHGPYYYLHYRAYDLERGIWCRRKTYVSARRVATLRRQIREAKAQARREHRRTRVFLAALGHVHA